MIQNQKQNYEEDKIIRTNIYGKTEKREMRRSLKM